LPTYEYRCVRCGYRFDKFQAMTEAPVRECPECGGPVERLIGSGAGVLSKGQSYRRSTRCGRALPCCGRNSPCDSPPCAS